MSEKGLIPKATSGQLQDIDTLDVVKGARMLTGGRVADLPIAAIEGDLEADKEIENINAKYGSGSDSPIVQAKYKELRSRWKDRLAQAAASTGGAVAGWKAGAIAGSLVPIPGATWAGGAAGAYFGSDGGAEVYKATRNYFDPVVDQDAIAIAEKIDQLRADGQPIPQELTGAMLLAGLTGESGQRATNELEKLTKETDFNVAIEAGQIDKLRPMIDTFEYPMRALVHLPPDAKGPTKSTARQITEMLDAGIITASDFIENPRGVALAYQEFKAFNESNMAVPNDSEIRQVANDLNDLGVAPAGNERMTSLPRRDNSNSKTPAA